MLKYLRSDCFFTLPLGNITIIYYNSFTHYCFNVNPSNLGLDLILNTSIIFTHSKQDNNNRLSISCARLSRLHAKKNIKMTVRLRTLHTHHFEWSQRSNKRCCKPPGLWKTVDSCLQHSQHSLESWVTEHQPPEEQTKKSFFRWFYITGFDVLA